MAYDIRSITQVGTSEPFELQVARGQIPGHSSVHKFGAVPEMSVNTTGTVWDIDDTLYPWSAFSSAQQIGITLADAQDVGKSVVVVGLDADYKEQSEVVQVNSQTETATNKSFIRVFRAYMHNGSAVNKGNINFLVGATTVARITADKGQTLMAVYTVPAGYTGYLTQGVMTIESGGDATGNMFVRYAGETAFRIGHTFEVASSEYHYAFTIPQRIPAKSDIDIRASVRTNNSRATAAFDIILIQEQGSL
jgi:hypothetical protein